VSSRRGLPDFRKMRHDRHFVEALEHEPSASVGRMIQIDLIEANREQPRSDLGDLSQLIASVRAKGILEPLLVRPSGEGGAYQLIAGERRLHAAREAGLVEVPCIELTVSDQEAIELALIENLQRQDLTAFEEADGYRTLVEKYNYTHEQVAQAVGKSRSTVTEALKLLVIPPALRDLCRHADITAKSVLLLIARASSVEEMERLIQELVENNLDRESLRESARHKSAEGTDATPTGDEAASAQIGRFRTVRLRFKPPTDLGIHFSLSIRKPGVSRQHVIATVEALLEQLRRGDHDDALSSVLDASEGGSTAT
jgi:ParB family transcriptional regulator, chromosome partitioning protein